MPGVHPYADPFYVEALGPTEGQALWVPDWGSACLKRPIAGGGYDAVGSYPLTPLSVSADLAAGLTQLQAEGLISVVMVPDPLHRLPLQVLSRHFSHWTEFKTHLLIDGPYAPSRHHRERIRRGYRRCQIMQGRLSPWLDDWKRLYARLVAHRGITGMADFRAPYFDRLAAIPGLSAFTASVDGQIVGMTLWFAQDGVVYNHLTACDETGYANSAAFALYDAAITAFAGQGVINLGGGSGASGADGGGLFAFKQGFANAEITAHICGQILDAEAYARLSAGKPPGFFPAYRG
ncbi:GNAT family N-acetyltransferase [Asticcacaulis sp. AND118]|uniref:GNAT family N-acetyltransferase n=1 Tax=Asticcacaulis sp. AND118 TaxID=2840468 RepID=UPI001CFF773C|nr:GNAT family N-acetyltransferase [Asticcacaulis sp. AND118]UDF03344.1 GNAT family N-acetyltransferase [Asticcacaulis sp. AND118]